MTIYRQADALVDRYMSFMGSYSRANDPHLKILRGALEEIQRTKISIARLPRITCLDADLDFLEGMAHELAERSHRSPKAQERD